jgi:hypothetical protein
MVPLNSEECGHRRDRKKTTGTLDGTLHIALGTLDFSAGKVSLLKMLLQVLAVLLIGSIGLSLANNFSILNTALTIITIQSANRERLLFGRCWLLLPQFANCAGAAFVEMAQRLGGAPFAIGSECRVGLRLGQPSRYSLFSDARYSR